MSKDITTHDSRRIHSDKHFTLITVNQTAVLRSLKDQPCITGYTIVSRQQSHPK